MQFVSMFPVSKAVMRQPFLLILFHLFLQPLVFGQRLPGNSQATPVVYKPAIFEGRYFTLTIVNFDTVPILLQLGPTKLKAKGDTLNLARTYPCSSPEIGEYYDLHDLVEQENNCLRWYTLQTIKPRDTTRFVVKLKDFHKSDSSRLYYSYTREVKKIDKELHMYEDTKTIYIMKEDRDFETNFITIDKNALNTGLAKVGLNIYISATNQQ
jgi:hypothetical protein